MSLEILKQRDIVVDDELSPGFRLLRSIRETQEGNREFQEALDRVGSVEFCDLSASEDGKPPMPLIVMFEEGLDPGLQIEKVSERTRRDTAHIEVNYLGIGNTMTRSLEIGDLHYSHIEGVGWISFYESWNNPRQIANSFDQEQSLNAICVLVSKNRYPGIYYFPIEKDILYPEEAGKEAEQIQQTPDAIRDSQEIVISEKLNSAQILQMLHSKGIQCIDAVREGKPESVPVQRYLAEFAVQEERFPVRIDVPAHVPKKEDKFAASLREVLVQSAASGDRLMPYDPGGEVFLHQANLRGKNLPILCQGIGPELVTTCYSPKSHDTVLYVGKKVVDNKVVGYREVTRLSFNSQGFLFLAGERQDLGTFSGKRTVTPGLLLVKDEKGRIQHKKLALPLNYERAFVDGRLEGGEQGQVPQKLWVRMNHVPVPVPDENDIDLDVMLRGGRIWGDVVFLAEENEAGFMEVTQGGVGREGRRFDVKVSSGFLRKFFGQLTAAKTPGRSQSRYVEEYVC